MSDWLCFAIVCSWLARMSGSHMGCVDRSAMGPSLRISKDSNTVEIEDNNEAIQIRLVDRNVLS